MAEKNKNIVFHRLVRSYVTSLISIALVLVLVGASAIFGFSANGLASYFKETVAVSLILKQNVSEKKARAMADSLAASPNVRSAEFISRERGAEELRDLLGEDFLSVFESTPIPVSIEVHYDGSMIAKDTLARLRTDFLKDERIEDVSYQEDMVEKLNSNIKKITAVLLAVVVALLVISSALINNTVRLSTYARRFTIHTMRLVGARNSFIARPFVIQAVIQGAVAGVLADAVLECLLIYLRSSSTLIFSIFNMKMVALCLIALVFLGMLICALSALMVVRKIAYSTKEDLYY